MIEIPEDESLDAVMDDLPRRAVLNRMITSLTPEQAALGKTFVDGWRAKAFAVRPTNKARAEEGFKRAYAALGLGVPKVVWCPSPLKGIEITSRHASKIGGDARGFLSAALIDVDTTNTIEPQLYKKLTDKFLTLNVPGKDVGDGVRAELNIRAIMIEEEDACSGCIGDRVSKLLRFLSINAVVVPSVASKLALASYMKTALNIGNDGILGLMDAAEAHWFWPGTKVIVASERPTVMMFDDKQRVHCGSGPAIRFADGFEIHCWHGVRVSREAFSTEEVKWDLIEQSADKDVLEALKDIRIKRWGSKVLVAPAEATADAGEVESAEDREKAAEAAQRLGGLDGLRGLITDDDEE